MRGKNRVLYALIAAHCILLGISCVLHSPSIDECGHLPSGFMNWKGRFDAYRVNPPIVRMIAALPLLAAHPEDRYIAAVSEHGYRAEYFLGHEFFRKYGERAMPYFIAGRLLCIPFCLLGLLVTYVWCREMYCEDAAIAAAAFWCFCPNMLAHGSMITPDAAASTSGVLCAWLLWRWLQRPVWNRTILLGLGVSFAVLTKFTWIVLIGVVPIWMLLSVRRLREWPVMAAKAGSVLLIVLYMMNAQYAFKGTGHSLEQLNPRSKQLSSLATIPWLRQIPVPLPEDVVLGLDTQACDFENGFDSYFCGVHRKSGWWNYYLVGMLLKMPIGFWVAFVFGLAAWCCRRELLRRDLGIPLLFSSVVLGLVSSQTGFAHHLRYVLPAFPFLYIMAASLLDRADGTDSPMIRVGFRLCVLVFVLESLCVFPHSLSFFNILAGGPANGHYYMINSNVDWGQDILLIQHWIHRHPETPVNGLALVYPSEFIFPETQEVPSEPMPGVWIISADRLHDADGKYEYFLKYEPVAMIGFSAFVYVIADETR